MAGVSERETTAGTIGRLAIGTATLAKIEGPGRGFLPFVKPVLPNLNRFLNRNRNRYEFF